MVYQFTIYLIWDNEIANAIYEIVLATKARTPARKTRNGKYFLFFAIFWMYLFK
jgi:hypothetical protein